MSPHKTPIVVLAGLLLLACAGSASAVEQVTVVALFKGKAVVTIDGTRRVLGEGEASPEGVVLVSADSRGAILEVDGQRRRYTLGSHVSTDYAAPRTPEVKIWPNEIGMYTAQGAINGHNVQFMLDTGATLVSMNARQALALDVDFRRSGQRGTVRTASGVVPAWQVRLDSVAVGPIRLNAVDAVVLEGENPSEVLLGMSFLGRLKIENRGRAMVLKQSH